MKWTTEQHRLYLRWCEMIKELYPQLPNDVIQRRAAEIVSNDKGRNA